MYLVEHRSPILSIADLHCYTTSCSRARCTGLEQQLTRAHLITGPSQCQMPRTVAFACWMIARGRRWNTTQPVAFPLATSTMPIRAVTFATPATPQPPLSGLRLQCYITTIMQRQAQPYTGQWTWTLWTWSLNGK